MHQAEAQTSAAPIDSRHCRRSGACPLRSACPAARRTACPSWYAASGADCSELIPCGRRSGQLPSYDDRSQDAATLAGAYREMRRKTGGAAKADAAWPFCPGVISVLTTIMASELKVRKPGQKESHAGIQGDAFILSRFDSPPDRRGVLGFRFCGRSRGLPNNVAIAFLP